MVDKTNERVDNSSGLTTLAVNGDFRRVIVAPVVQKH